MSLLTFSRVLVLIACIVFVLAAFGVSPAGVGFVPLGLAIWAASELIP
jgi:hypothetical protein